MEDLTPLVYIGSALTFLSGYSNWKSGGKKFNEAMSLPYNSEEREILFSESSVLEDKGFYKMILTPLFVAIWYYTYGIDYHAYIDLELPNNLAYKQPLQASDNFNLILRLKFPIN
jgi:hypothetical protein